MKKAIIILSLILVLCLALVSCNVDNTDTSTNTDSETQTDTSTDTDTAIDTSIQVEYDAEREAQDSEFPFESIIIERNGYDMVSAGRYYGNDFDNVKYYGSYYRIIDNYEDFSELTQWGEKIDESVFNENFVLTLYTYKKSSVYYSHLELNDLNSVGEFENFTYDKNSNELNITEARTDDILSLDSPDYVPPSLNDSMIMLPLEIQETIYLIIPKEELPENLKIRGEISLNLMIMVAE